MTPEQRKQIYDLFERALELSQQDREALLNNRCDDPLVRQEVLNLLASDPPTTTFDAISRVRVDHFDAKSPISIDGYEIVRELNHGGQAVVLQAIQLSTKRKVAIKLLLNGKFASKAARHRFEREVELVAQLKHPNIISIFHSGRTNDGYDYCVMDYVRGLPLDQFVRNNKLTLEQTLTLVTTVCDAVQYAHQKGVIHRDLKPSNILVETDGTPRVLDFGLAKQLTEPVDTLVTVTGQVIGTLPYMSPEQAKGNPDLIDTRTDVYALGVMLYELLTGQYPYPVVGQMADVLKHIAETQPVPPTRKWSSDSGITRRETRRYRAGTCPIDSELQTIAMKALSKDVDRRYQTAIDFSRDLLNYLAGKPITAKRDSFSYLLRLTVRRHASKLKIAFILLLAIGWPIPELWILSQEHTYQMFKRNQIRNAFHSAQQEINSLDATVCGVVNSALRDAKVSLKEDRIVVAQQWLDRYLSLPPVNAMINHVGIFDPALGWYVSTSSQAKTSKTGLFDDPPEAVLQLSPIETHFGESWRLHEDQPVLLRAIQLNQQRNFVLIEFDCGFLNDSLYRYVYDSKWRFYQINYDGSHYPPDADPNGMINSLTNIKSSGLEPQNLNFAGEHYNVDCNLISRGHARRYTINKVDVKSKNMRLFRSLVVPSTILAAALAWSCVEFLRRRESTIG